MTQCDAQELIRRDFNFGRMRGVELEVEAEVEVEVEVEAWVPGVLPVVDAAGELWVNV